MKKINYKIGDVIAIPTENSNFIFGRVLRDASIAIWDFISKDNVEIEILKTKKTLVELGFFDTEILSGNWKVIGHIPFTSESEHWPAPKYIQDIINPDKFRISHRGEMRDATADEIKGLERSLMYKPAQLVEEVLRTINKDTNNWGQAI